jgi:anti-anti-sigma factor
MPYPDELSAALRGAVAHLDGRTVYALAGELDLDGAEPFRTRAAELLDGPGPDLIVDLGELVFIDSHGLRALFEIKGLADANARRFGLVNARPPVLRMLQITGLIERFEVEPA